MYMHFKWYKLFWDTLFIEITTKNAPCRHVRLKIISHEKKSSFPEWMLNNYEKIIFLCYNIEKVKLILSTMIIHKMKSKREERDTLL